eukprot:scaffold1761_cov357-Prasinococcus_capsulatus_cf.AAC.4
MGLNSALHSSSGLTLSSPSSVFVAVRMAGVDPVVGNAKTGGLSLPKSDVGVGEVAAGASVVVGASSDMLLALKAIRPTSLTSLRVMALREMHTYDLVGGSSRAAPPNQRPGHHALRRPRPGHCAPGRSGPCPKMLPREAPAPACGRPSACCWRASAARRPRAGTTASRRFASPPPTAARRGSAGDARRGG